MGEDGGLDTLVPSEEGHRDEVYGHLMKLRALQVAAWDATNACVIIPVLPSLGDDIVGAVM